MSTKLTAKEVQNKLQEVLDWKISDDNSFLIREYKFKNWQEVVDFINKISEVAESLNHHPNINFTYGFCKIEIQTHDVKGITDLDFKLAKKISNL